MKKTEKSTAVKAQRALTEQKIIDIADDVEHSVAKRDLRTPNNNANDRLDESIGRLMGARVRVKIERDGKEYIRSVSLLETVEEPVRADGQVYYRFPRPLRKLISDSSIFARLSKEVMLNLSSKYALALYEMVQKRGLRKQCHC